MSDNSYDKTVLVRTEEVRDLVFLSHSTQAIGLMNVGHGKVKQM